MTVTELNKIKIDAFLKFKKEISDWRPMVRGRGYPTSDKIQASKHQIYKIWKELDSRSIDAYGVVFTLYNREDGMPRKKRLFELDKGDAWDTIQAIKKNKLNKIIK